MAYPRSHSRPEAQRLRTLGWGMLLLSLCLPARGEEAPAQGDGNVKVVGNKGFESGQRKNLIFEDGFESGGWTASLDSGSTAGKAPGGPTWYQSMNQGDYSAAAVKSPVRTGVYAMRFEWRTAGLKEGSNVSRKATLFTGKEPTAHEERWAGFSIYFPSEGMEADSKGEIIVQWHSTPDQGEAYTNPPLTLSNKNDRLSVSWIYDEREITPKDWKQWDRKTLPVGDTPKDKWVDFVFHIRWSPTGKGLLQVWRDGQKMVDEKEIAIGFNDKIGNYVGIGIYKYPVASDHEKRVVLFDEFRLGNAEATYDDVAPTPAGR